MNGSGRGDGIRPQQSREEIEHVISYCLPAACCGEQEEAEARDERGETIPHVFGTGSVLWQQAGAVANCLACSATVEYYGSTTYVRAQYPGTYALPRVTRLALFSFPSLGAEETAASSAR